MGKRRRLNRFITKWIKSDLPVESDSTVLLLQVTRIATSPVPPRRPCSLAIQPPTSPLPRHRLSLRTDCNVLLLEDVSRSQSDSSTPSPTSTPQARQRSLDCDSGDSLAETTPIQNAMDRSVDSIGTCSLDVDASADSTDWSESLSVGTLRSTSIKSPVVVPEPRLPSYLSLACTVNGYSTTTNYDPERLAKSRDTSPHRPHEHASAQSENLTTYATHNNLLSPPNLVPLPMQKFNINSNSNNMAEHTIAHHHQEYYSNKTRTYMTKEISFTDTVDTCLEKNKYSNGILSDKIEYESNKIISETIQEYKNGVETKSFIQQRVERLYGPGALALVVKRQLNRSFEVSAANNKIENDKFSKSMSDKLLEDDDSFNVLMKQSNSSPSLPVLRHLTPEFRAQLPSLRPQKRIEFSTLMQKSSTVPVLKEEALNGCDKPKENGNGVEDSVKEICDSSIPNNNGLQTDVKDGHYFLKILDTEAKRLLVLADIAEQELQSEDLSEDAKGFLRSASGKARLLVSQKMQQFKGLCTNNITQVEGDAFPTTCEDLQGFWDMVMLQVDQVDDIFKELEVLRSNNWVEKKKPIDITTKSAKPRKAVTVPRAQSAGAEEARKKREAQRKQLLEERRKAMKKHQQIPIQQIEIFVPESS